MNVSLFRAPLSVFLLSLLLLTFASPAAAEKPYPPLMNCSNPALQAGLEQSLASLKLDQAVRDGSLCVAVVDVTHPESPKLAEVNGNEMMYAASLPKIAILLGAFTKIEHGELTLTEGLREKLTRMIRFSSNAAATQILHLVGKKYLAQLLESPRYHLYNPQRNGGLWVGKDYGPAPAWKRDPLHHLSHGATAFEVARYYYLLQTGRLVSPEFSQEMKAILGRPAIHHYFVKGLAKADPDAKIYRKSGTWRTFHADSAIVEHDGRRYIAVALADNPAGGRWLSRLIVGIDGLICRSDAGPR